MWFAVPLLLFLQEADHNAVGRKALEEQKYEEAAQAFAKAIQADPKDYTAHFHLAFADSMLQKDAEAIAEYKKALELQPGLYQAELNLGILLIRQKQGQEAADYLRQAANQKPNESRPHFYLGELFLSTGQAERAEIEYQRALEIDPKLAGAELGLGRCQARQERLADAATHFRKAAELDPGFKDALLELAALYEKNNQTAEAIAIYQQFPGNAAAQEHLGQLMIESRKYAEAIPILEQAAAKDPTAANRLALAQAYLFHKQYDKALPLFDQLVAAEPASYDLRMMYARALRDQKQYAPAARQFAEAVKLRRDSIEAWKEFAATLYLLDNYPQALEALDQAKRLGDNSPANYYFHAIILDKLRDLKGALENYQAFLAVSQGKFPDEEFKARQRARIIQKELSKR